jgi:EmrB/QacA subfamily drug resistance transporter
LPNGPDQSERPAEHATAKPSKFLTVFPSIMLPMFLAVVDQTIVATALPAIVAATGQVERASWIVVSYLIAATIAAPVYGRLGDSFGRRRLMFTALAVFIIASLLCAAAPTVEWLTLARVLQGFGGGGLMTLSQALIGEAVPPRERARYQGYLAAVAVSANTFGPVAGGYLTEHFGWQSIFLVNVPVGLVAVALTWRLHNPTVERLPWKADPGGLVLFVVLVVTTLLALEQVQHVELGALPLGAGLFAISLCAAAWLIRHENKAPSPLIPLHLLRLPAIWRSDAMAACHGAALVSLITFLPVYLQAVRGTTPSTTGFLLVPLTIGIGTGSLVVGRLVSKTGYTTIFPIVGMALATVCFVTLAFFASAMGMILLSVLLLFIGAFLGTVMGVVQVTVQTVAGQARLGEAAASVQFSRSIGAAFGTALVATALFATLTIRNPEAAKAFAAMVEHAKHVGPALSPIQQASIQTDIAEAFRVAFLAIATFTAAGFFLALTNPLRRI